MDRTLIDEVANNLSKEYEDVEPVISELFLQLHKRFVEYKGLNGDYIGEQLQYDIGRQAFFHFLGLLDHFSDNYDWEKGIAKEYLMRLGSRADWLPFSHQMDSWKHK